jgi:hypothetical protein
MPNRIIRERLRICPKLNALKPIEELFFIHLITACDDFGRMDARLPVLRARLFPLAEHVQNDEIGAAMATLERVGLLERYEVEGLPYVQLPTWEKYQRVRNKRSRYPPPWPILEEDG